MDETQKGLLRVVLEKPWDDAPRLVYADWLTEHGEEDRAEFIRVQCELERSRHSGNWTTEEEVLLRKEQALLTLARYTVVWREGLVEKIPAGRSLFSRGFISSVSLTLDEFVGVACSGCGGRGFSGRLIDGRWEHRRCDICPQQVDQDRRHLGTGRLPGLAKNIFSVNPVMEVKLTDIYIYQSAGNDTFYMGNLGVFPSKYWRQLESLPSWHAVEKASSRVCVSYGRELAGLPTLPDDKTTTPRHDTPRETEARR